MSAVIYRHDHMACLVQCVGFHLLLKKQGCRLSRVLRLQESLKVLTPHPISYTKQRKPQSQTQLLREMEFVLGPPELFLRYPYRKSNSSEV